VSIRLLLLVDNTADESKNDRSQSHKVKLTAARVSVACQRLFKNVINRKFKYGRQV